MSSSYYARLAEHQRIFDEEEVVLERLLPEEQFWLEHQPWLESRGYMLRPRYRPGWIPSWRGKNKPSILCEDGQFLQHSQLMDAIRISDGAIVAMKMTFLSSNPTEVKVHQFLSSGDRASHPRNHCIPIFEILQVPEEPTIQLIVMPFVRPFNNPRFQTIGEAVEFFRQIFEGIQFMHENRVAHRDCSGRNIMMDTKLLYPNGHHPVNLTKNRDYRGYAKHYTRTERPPRYLLVDFGLSKRFDSKESRPLALPVNGLDRTVPEFQGKAYTKPSDPFPTDVYYLGNMIKTYFVDKYFGFDFISSLVVDMTQDDPSRRPTINEVVTRFEVVRRSLSVHKLRSRTIRRKRDAFAWWRNSAHFFRKMRYIIRGIPPVPPSSA